MIVRAKHKHSESKQVNNNKQERRTDARGSRRCGSVTKETRGRKEGKTAAGMSERFGKVFPRSPVHGPRGGRRGEEELF